MRLLALLCSIGCAGAELMPGCYSTSCVTRDYTHTGGWLVKDYLVDGALMSVATKPGDYAVRWSCHGLNPIDEPAPRVYTSYIAYEVELIDCDIPQTVSYMDAGLTAMPQLRNATFIEVYMMGRLFGNCTNLNHLALIDGTLSVLPDHWLVGCSALISLKITQLRNLNKVPGDLLDDTTVLRYLDLSHNSLEALPEGLLDNTRSLEHLNVGDNNLKTLPENLPISLKRVEACGNDQRPLTYKTLSTLEHWACIKIMSQL
ncbi:uncharacterized protein LOC125227451 isoform X2 [Leguminivora glycinivorella]|uniref:uncharacterized protein LOC125227451 isoform X2 n=1 Tax=Leguminivora glycinivorella TaxID=1035111 RepID=UPI0020108FBF|nr:uncharacterized protein LOC125227451 isoform X2 [Leguminivora glycinivorella]